MASLLKVIRAKCLECCNGQANEVKECVIKTCPLYNYRLGKNPDRVRKEMTDEQKEACALRMKQYWENKRNQNNNN